AKVPERSTDRTELSIHGIRGAHSLRSRALTPASTRLADPLRLLHEHRAERDELPLVEIVDTLDPSFRGPREELVDGRAVKGQRLGGELWMVVKVALHRRGKLGARRAWCASHELKPA